MFKISTATAIVVGFKLSDFNWSVTCVSRGGGGGLRVANLPLPSGG